MLNRITIILSAFFVLAASAQAQQGYEFEVYSTSVPARGSGELELHTNFVPSGSQLSDDAEGRATNRALRSSVELSTGLASWLEASVYAVTYARSASAVCDTGDRALFRSGRRNWNRAWIDAEFRSMGYHHEARAQVLRPRGVTR